MDNSTQMGTNAETSFVKCMRANGHFTQHSSKHEDMVEHWDFLIDGRYKVEVKSMKKARRHDTTTKNDWIYVEFKNVHGNIGWLYGEADYIAFEQPEGFLLVPKEPLIDMAETLITTEWVDRPTPYKSYKRRDRPNEHIGVLMLRDIKTLPHKLIKA